MLDELGSQTDGLWYGDECRSQGRGCWEIYQSLLGTKVGERNGLSVVERA